MDRGVAGDLACRGIRWLVWSDKADARVLLQWPKMKIDLAYKFPLRGREPRYPDSTPPPWLTPLPMDLHLNFLFYNSKLHLANMHIRPRGECIGEWYLFCETSEENWERGGGVHWPNLKAPKIIQEHVFVFSKYWGILPFLFSHQIRFSVPSFGSFSPF